jgi:phenylpropionate dioxygenase-like ring-hydroxylating dioxygenase large terminal subunit
MPFLRNLWYVAANAGELDTPLVSRTICNERIVMYRKESGEVVALEDRCPHRFVPLSLGQRVGDSLRCGYHGLLFAPDGSCAEMPNDADGDIGRVCVRSYPAIERYGVVWIWMGDDQLADPAKIPEFGFITDDAFTGAQGYLHIKANHQLITDNLLDLSHVHYLHPTVNQGGNFATFKNKVRAEGHEVWSMLWRPNLSFSADRIEMMGLSPDAIIDGEGHSRWTAPSLMYVYTAWAERGNDPQEHACSPSAHLITPETEYTSHYFWAIGRNFNIEDEEMTRISAEMVHNVFTTQDGPMIEAQQADMGQSIDFLKHKPIILKADAAGVLARRTLHRMIKQEQTVSDNQFVETAAE